MSTESHGSQEELHMKTNPQGTGFPNSIHHRHTGVIRRHRSYSPKPLSTLPEVRASFFCSRPSCYVGSDAVARPSATIRLQINQDRPTSVPVRYAAQGQAFHSVATGEGIPDLTHTLLPLKPKELGLPSFSATLTTMT
jgi:hypothetical protein